MSAQSANEAVLSGINGKEILRFALDPADDDMIKIRQLYLKAIVGIPGKFFVVMPSRKTLHCLLYTSPSPRDRQKSRMPSSA